MTDSTDNARELAYQSYINEMTPNGNTRITNLTLCNTGPRAHQHIATQVDLAFHAGWSARADLAAPSPDVLAQSKHIKTMCDAVRRGDLEAACDALGRFDSALARITDTGGQKGG